MNCICFPALPTSFCILQNKVSDEKARPLNEHDWASRKPAPTMSSPALSPHMYLPMSMNFPPNSSTNINAWIPSSHYSSMHAPRPPPQQDFYHLSSAPEASFDSSGSHGNQHYTRTTTPTHDHGSMTVLGGHLTQHNLPSHTGFARPYAISQPRNSYYGIYPPAYSMCGPTHVYADARSQLNANGWTLPTPPPRPPQPVLLVYDVTPADVLCGRGGATNSHSGNRAFRSLVKKHQVEYLKAKKRDKPAVALVIVDLVRKQGGRFLRRYERLAPNGQVLWVDIGDDRAREKVRSTESTLGYRLTRTHKFSILEDLSSTPRKCT